MDGSRGRVVVPSFAVLHLDNRLLVETSAGSREEQWGDRSSYGYQLTAVAAALSGAGTFALGINDAVFDMQLVDACYQAAGLSPRNGTGERSLPPTT